MFKLIKILVLALLLPVSANAGFHGGDVEEHKRLSKLIMQHGEIIHSTAMKDAFGNEIIGNALYHVRVQSNVKIFFNEVPKGIYICVVGIDPRDVTFMDCEKL